MTARADPSEHGNRLGGAGDDARLRDALREDCTHPVDRLDRDDVVAAFDEQPRQLPGSRAHVDDGVAGLQRHRFGDPVERLGGIRRACALVRLGRAAEGVRAWMDAQYAPRCAITAGTVLSRIVTSSQIDQCSR